METEALRKQLSEEIATQFDAKLREAKRQKSQIEEEFEQSSEKWRTERRRLNAEIDRLESALAEARQSGRESSEPRLDVGVDPQEVAQLQAAAEEKIKDAAQSWEKERAKLQAEISRLQEGIAELIERTNNPLRANPNERGKLEVKYDEALRAKRQAEEALVAAKAEWEAERLHLANEATKLRPSIARTTVPRKADDPLDKRLQESVRVQEALASDLEKARLELSRLKQAHASELQSMTSRLQAAASEWETEKLNFVDEATKLRQAAAQVSAPRKVDDQLDKRLQEAVQLRDGLASDLEKARMELSKLKEAHASELQNAIARLQSAKTEWESEKLNLVNEATKLRQSATQAAAQAAAPRKADDQLDKQLQEAVQLRDGLAADLEKARAELSKLKEAHASELQNAIARLQSTKTEWESEKLNLVNEATKLRQAAAQAAAPRKVDEQLDKRLQEAVQLRDRLTADLEKARAELSKLKEAHASELQNAIARLQSAKTEWESEKLKLVNEATKLRQSATQAPAQAGVPRKGDEQLDKRLQETVRVRDGLSSELEKARHEIAKLKETHSAELKDFTSRYIKTRSDLEKQLRESEEIRVKLERELEQAQKASATQDGAVSEEVSRLRKELDASLEEKNRMVIRLAETGDMVSADVVNDLRHEFEVRMQEIILENSQLSEKVKSATSQLANEGATAKASDGAGQSGAPVSTLDASAIDEEVKRIEDLTAEIGRLIDDPETELATVIRKNVERAALDSYLKGILFSLGRGKKL